jgi:hypothetical protein
MGSAVRKEVAHAVEMTDLCQNLNVLPYAGGLFEQPWIVVEMMRMIIKAKSEKAERERKKGGAKHS